MQRHWDEFRKWNLIGMIAWAGLLPIVLLLFFLSYFVPLLEWAPVILYGSIFLVISIAQIKLRRLKCPRCHQRFFATYLPFGMRGRMCRHCGLSVYADV
jgi:hypothetical protein